MLYSCSFIRALSTVYSLFLFYFHFSLFQPSYKTLEHEIKPRFSAAVHSVCKELGQAEPQAIRVFPRLT